MSDSDPTLQILIQIREELAGLTRTRDALKGTKEEAGKLGQVLRQGLGIGSGIEIARRSIDLLRSSIRASVGEAFRLAGEIKDQSEALGITTQAYQVMRYELVQAGVDAGRLNMAIDYQTRSLAEARAGAGAAAQAYKSLGLEAAQIETLSPEQRMIAVAQAVLGATDQTRAFHAASQILGTRGTPQLLAALRNLATDGYDNVAARAKAANAVMDKSLVDLLDSAKKRIDNFRQFTLPVATGQAIGFAQNAMDWVGATAANAVNHFQGLPMASRFDGAAPSPPPKQVPTPGPDSAENILAVRLADAQQRAAQVNGALVTEHQRRSMLLPILEQQEQLYRQIAEAQGGPGWELRLQGLRSGAASGSLTEKEVAQYRELAELEGKLSEVRQERLRNIDTPLAAMQAELVDTTGLLETSISGALNAGISSLSSNIWGAFQNTRKFSEAWRGLGNIAGQVLTEMMVKLLVVRPLLGLFGVGGSAPGGGSALGALQPKGFLSGAEVFGAPGVKAAGGGTFLTSGPTSFTVGDNPGGMELVSVVPLSGRGQTTVGGRNLQMAGGGSALVAGARATAVGGAPVTINFNFATGVAATVRAEVLSMSGELRELAVNAVQEAHLRNRLGFA